MKPIHADHCTTLTPTCGGLIALPVFQARRKKNQSVEGVTSFCFLRTLGGESRTQTDIVLYSPGRMTLVGSARKGELSQTAGWSESVLIHVSTRFDYFPPEGTLS